MGGNEYAADVFGYLLHFLDAALFGDLVHQFFAVKTAFAGRFLKIRIDLHQLVVVHDVAHETQCKQRFDAAGASGDNAQCAGGGNGRGGRIAILDAGILKDKRATCFPSAKNDLSQKGAQYTGKPVEVDGKIITSSGPNEAKQFAEEIKRFLKE